MSMITVEEFNAVLEAVKLAESLNEAILRFEHGKIQLSDIIAKVEAFENYLTILDTETLTKLSDAKAKLEKLK